MIPNDLEQIRLNAWGEHPFVFQAALNTITDAVYLKDTGGRYIAINAAGAAFVGVSPGEIVGRTDPELFTPETASMLRATDERVMATGETTTVEEYLGTPHGLRLFRSTKGACVDDTGTPIGVFGISRDITEARELEKERRDLQRALELSAQGVARLGLDWRFVWVNEAFASLCGSTPDEMRGAPAGAFALAEEGALIAAACTELTDGGRFDLEIRPVRPDGAVVVARLTGMASHDIDGSVNGFYCTLHDITDEKGAQGELQAAAAELERCNDELAYFASLAAHDLRQPLQVMGGFAELLAQRYGDQLDDKAKGYVAAICRGADTMQVMVESLLEFAGDAQPAPPTTLVDTSRIVSDVVASLHLALAGGSVIVAGSLPLVPGDPAQLTRLFQNLIGNALKFHGDEPPMVQVSAERKGDAGLFSVSDNGIGISPAFADRLFEMLQRERRGDYPGTGMGLAICRKIVTFHGGRIWLEPGAAGRGSTFRFTLPAGPAASAPRTTEERA